MIADRERHALEVPQSLETRDLQTARLQHPYGGISIREALKQIARPQFSRRKAGRFDRRQPLLQRATERGGRAGQTLGQLPHGAGTTGRSTRLSYVAPKCSVVVPLNTASGRSRGSSCRNGPQPENGFFMLDILSPAPPAC